MQRRVTFYEKYIKRLLDFMLSLISLIILSPVLVVISVLVRVKLGKPIFFKQKRPGLNEKIFTIYKFRTMTDEKNSNGELLSDSERLTTFGKWLRSTSLDELPELFNILIGDMSIVGPRPQLVRDIVFMSAEQRTRHSVIPGLTGLAQVEGRNNITWEEKIKLDMKYIEKIGFFYDFNIMFRTLIAVLKRDNVATDGMDTAEDLGDYLLRIGAVDKFEYKDKLNMANDISTNS